MTDFQAPRANRSLADLSDELNVEYVKPSKLAGHRVNLIGARTRTGQFGEECIFEVQYLDGTERGCTAFVSLGHNAARERLVSLVRRDGSIGPVKLAQVGEVIKGNKPWGFVDAPDPAQMDAMKGSATAGVGSANADEDDKLPF